MLAALALLSMQATTSYAGIEEIQTKWNKICAGWEQEFQGELIPFRIYWNRKDPHDRSFQKYLVDCRKGKLKTMGRISDWRDMKILFNRYIGYQKLNLPAKQANILENLSDKETNELFSYYESYSYGCLYLPSIDKLVYDYDTQTMTLPDGSSEKFIIFQLTKK